MSALDEYLSLREQIEVVETRLEELRLLAERLELGGSDTLETRVMIEELETELETLRSRTARVA